MKKHIKKSLKRSKSPLARVATSIEESSAKSLLIKSKSPVAMETELMQDNEDIQIELMQGSSSHKDKISDRVSPPPTDTKISKLIEDSNAESSCHRPMSPAIEAEFMQESENLQNKKNNTVSSQTIFDVEERNIENLLERPKSPTAMVVTLTKPKSPVVIEAELMQENNDLQTELMQESSKNKNEACDTESSLKRLRSLSEIESELIEESNVDSPWQRPLSPAMMEAEVLQENTTSNITSPQMLFDVGEENIENSLKRPMSPAAMVATVIEESNAESLLKRCKLPIVMESEFMQEHEDLQIELMQESSRHKNKTSDTVSPPALFDGGETDADSSLKRLISPAKMESEIIEESNDEPMSPAVMEAELIEENDILHSKTSDTVSSQTLFDVEEKNQENSMESPKSPVVMVATLMEESNSESVLKKLKSPVVMEAELLQENNYLQTELVQGSCSHSNKASDTVCSQALFDGEMGTEFIEESNAERTMSPAVMEAELLQESDNLQYETSDTVSSQTLFSVAEENIENSLKRPKSPVVMEVTLMEESSAERSLKRPISLVANRTEFMQDKYKHQNNSTNTVYIQKSFDAGETDAENPLKLSTSPALTKVELRQENDVKFKRPKLAVVIKAKSMQKKDAEKSLERVISPAMMENTQNHQNETSETVIFKTLYNGREKNIESSFRRPSLPTLINVEEEYGKEVVHGEAVINQASVYTSQVSSVVSDKTNVHYETDKSVQIKPAIYETPIVNIVYQEQLEDNYESSHKSYKDYGEIFPLEKTENLAQNEHRNKETNDKTNGKIVSNSLCKYCKGNNHNFKNCPSVSCFFCKQTGHPGSSCPSPLFCLICQKLGHPAADCPDIICRGCQKKGHAHNKCPYVLAKRNQKIQAVRKIY